MSINSLLKFFQPRDRVFFNLFENVVDTVDIMAKKLREVVHEPDFSNRAIIIAQIEALEHDNDNLYTSDFSGIRAKFHHSI
jgi:uncharacterized protein Yka (UPF0111/DUF47 family)